MADYEPIFAQNDGAAPPPPPALPPPAPPPMKKKGGKKKKSGSADSIQPSKRKSKKSVEQDGDDEEGGDEFAQSTYSTVGQAGADGAVKGKQMTAAGRACYYILIVWFIVSLLAAVAFGVMIALGKSFM